MKRYAIWIVLAIAVVGLAVFLTTKKPENAPTSSTQPSTEPATQSATNNQEQPSGNAVSITSSGFSPNQLTVKSGTTVTWTNNDSQQHWPASNPHPIHNGLPGFDALKGLSQGQTYSFTFVKTGTFGYHDHLNPGSTAQIIVQ